MRKRYNAQMSSKSRNFIHCCPVSCVKWTWVQSALIVPEVLKMLLEREVLRQRSLHYCPCCLGCSASGMIGSGNVCSSDNPQSNIWDQVEQENTDLIQRHSRIVQGIKLLTRQIEPCAVKAIHPIVRQQEAQ